jgi:hypothetical protein
VSTVLATQPNGRPPATVQITIDHTAVLKAVGIDVKHPEAQALLLICSRYGLDPVLKHVVLIQGRIYVTRDGLLHVAHKSGQFDGIEVLDQTDSTTHHVAKVAVYRKDMTRPFTYVGRYPKNGANKLYGPEMAVKCAEVMCFRRAFDVSAPAREEQWDLDDSPAYPVQPAAAEAPRDDPRREVDAAFSRREPAASIAPCWAMLRAEFAQAHRAWTDELAGYQLDPPESVEFGTVFQVKNDLISYCLQEEWLVREEIAKPSDPTKRDKDRCAAALERLYREGPRPLVGRVRTHLEELRLRARAELTRRRPDAFDDAEDLAGDVAEAMERRSKVVAPPIPARNAREATPDLPADYGTSNAGAYG